MMWSKSCLANLGWLLKHLPGEFVLLEQLLLGPEQESELLHLLAVHGPQGQQVPQW